MYLIYAYLGYYIEFPFMKSDQFCLDSSKLWQHVNIDSEFVSVSIIM